MLTVLIASSAHAQWELEKIWDRSQGVPGAPGINVVLDEPAYDGVNFVFRTRKTGEYDGIHMIDGDGEIHLVTDVNSTIEPLAPPRSFDDPSSDGGRITSVVQLEHLDAIYLVDEGEVTSPVNLFTPAPGGPGFLTNLIDARLSGDYLIYTGRSVILGHPAVRGVYLHDLATGTDELIINDEQPVPGLPDREFFSFDSIDIENETYVFNARFSGLTTSAIFTNLTGELNLIVDDSTPMPNSSTTFNSAGDVRLQDGLVCFRGYSGTGLGGLFTWNNGSVSSVADTTTLLNDRKTRIKTIFAYTTHTGSFVFLANTDFDPPEDFLDPSGLFAVVDGELSTILRIGDELEGKVIQRILLHEQGLHDRTVAFLVSFGASSAIYTATLCTDGDANGDHLVNMADLNIVLGNFLRSGEPGLPGDVNDDGAVDLSDLNLVIEHFGMSCV